MWLRHKMTLRSRCRYLFWRRLGWPSTCSVKLKNGPSLRLRTHSDDLDTAYETFVAQLYDCQDMVNRPVRIVDLGANVGFTVLWWLNHFPDAHVDAVEPHPEHVKCIEANLALNKLKDQVRIASAAAGTEHGEMYLTDNGIRSRLVPDAEGTFQTVPVIDAFDELLGQRAIDLLKIDIEGSEYPLLEDVRFANVEAAAIILEWHETADYPDRAGEDWCRAKLLNLGYHVVRSQSWGRDCGMLYAINQNPASKSETELAFNESTPAASKKLHG